MRHSDLIFSNEFPAPARLGQELLLIYDKILLKKSPAFRQWSRSFPLQYAVSAGEDLKAVENFPRHIGALVQLCEKVSTRHLTLVVVGGGSVGDFGGFVASILKRGVGLVHIPSTWLAALDSSHGGKTALNVGSVKNQIGTFYPADKIVMVRSLLLAQPEARAFEGFGELLKIAWIQGGSLWRDLAQEKNVSSPMLWKYLEAGVAAKYKVVKKDPEEKTGWRHILNLGHTVGHLLEVLHQLPHGISVNYGLDFSLRWSWERGLMSSSQYEKIMRAPVSQYLLSAGRDHLLSRQKKDLNEFSRLLLSDKKKTKAQTLRFIFLQSPGRCVIQEVTVEEVIKEMVRQQEAALHEL
ncbi:MAG: hypothetical protein AAGB31_15115 [Bdellovibrio sp.]